MELKTLKDIEALEQKGFNTVFPNQSPWEILRHSARDHSESVAIRYLNNASDPTRDTVLTYSEFFARIMAAGRLFRSLGLVPGKSVVILSQHTASAQIALWGAQLAGAVCPVNPMLTPAHIAALIKAANGVALVITGPNAELDYWSTLVPALREQGVELPILACDVGDGVECLGSGGIFEDMLDNHMTGDDIEPEGDAHELAALYHTGGTTGAPKLVQHSRLNEAHVAQSCAMMHDLSRDDVVINGFPLFHVAGAFVYGLSTLSAGGTLLIPGRLGMRNQTFIRTIWQQVERHNVTVIGVVPTILATLNGIKVDADISSLRWLLTGGSPLPPELAEIAERHTGKGVRNILGMTESAGAIALEPVHAPRIARACGLRLPFSEVVILGETDGAADPAKPLSVGEIGIIGIRGPNISVGYTDPARNAGTFLPGGWLISGDLGRIDAQGCLFITGRKKDVIIRGAHNIDPQMIEDALLAHDQVENAAAVGMPDAYAGELPVAFVSLRKAASVDARALTEFLRKRMEDPTAIPKHISIMDTLPVTPVGKIFKPALRRTAIGWAITAAALELGIAADAVQIAISDTLDTHVTVPSGHLAAFRAAVAGMPLTLTIEAGNVA